jgi:hypothetical protein
MRAVVYEALVESRPELSDMNNFSGGGGDGDQPVLREIRLWITSICG